MKRKNYVPRDEDELSSWAGSLNSATENATNTEAMGWTTGNVSTIQTKTTQIVSAVAAKENARQQWISVNSEQDIVIADALADIRPLVAEGKAKPTATEAVQKALHVWGTEHEFDPGTYVGELKSAKAQGGGMVLVKFSKAGGELDAVNLYARKTGETVWTMVATMLRSPFTHHVALVTPGVPESIELRVRGVVGNAEIGSPSPAVTVLVD